MMKGEGGPWSWFWFWFCFGGFCFGGGMWRKRREIKLGSGECWLNLDTLHLVGLGLGGLGNLWRFPALGNTS